MPKKSVNVIHMGTVIAYVSELLQCKDVEFKHVGVGCYEHCLYTLKVPHGQHVSQEVNALIICFANNVPSHPPLLCVGVSQKASE